MSKTESNICPDCGIDHKAQADRLDEAMRTGGLPAFIAGLRDAKREIDHAKTQRRKAEAAGQAGQDKTPAQARAVSGMLPVARVADVNAALSTALVEAIVGGPTLASLDEGTLLYMRAPETAGEAPKTDAAEGFDMVDCHVGTVAMQNGDMGLLFPDNDLVEESLPEGTKLYAKLPPATAARFAAAHAAAGPAVEGTDDPDDLSDLPPEVQEALKSLAEAGVGVKVITIKV